MHRQGKIKTKIVVATTLHDVSKGLLKQLQLYKIEPQKIQHDRSQPTVNVTAKLTPNIIQLKQNSIHPNSK